MSYRVPDTDLALSASRSDDRTTLSLTCVPDDSAPLLGPARLRARGHAAGPGADAEPEHLGLRAAIDTRRGN